MHRHIKGQKDELPSVHVLPAPEYRVSMGQVLADTTVSNGVSIVPCCFAEPRVDPPYLP